MGALEIIYNEGMAEGEARGLVRGAAEASIRLLQRRGFTPDEPLVERIRQTKELSTLYRWLDRCLEAETLEQVFAADPRA